MSKFELGTFREESSQLHQVDTIKLESSSFNGSFTTDIDHCIHDNNNRPRGGPFHQPADENLARYIHIDIHPNGGASVVHMYRDEIQHLDKQCSHELAKAFFTEVFKEDKKGNAKHVMGIVHQAVRYLPELLSYLDQKRPDLVVKVGHLRNPEVETCRMEEYVSRVRESYSHTTFRHGPLLQLSLVGQFSEESGAYFPELLGEDYWPP